MLQISGDATSGFRKLSSGTISASLIDRAWISCENRRVQIVLATYRGLIGRFDSGTGWYFVRHEKLGHGMFGTANHCEERKCELLYVGVLFVLFCNTGARERCTACRCAWAAMDCGNFRICARRAAKKSAEKDKEKRYIVTNRIVSRSMLNSPAITMYVAAGFKVGSSSVFFCEKLPRKK